MLPPDWNNNFLLIKRNTTKNAEVKVKNFHNWGLFLTGSGRNLLFVGFSFPSFPRSAPQVLPAEWLSWQTSHTRPFPAKKHQPHVTRSTPLKPKCCTTDTPRSHLLLAFPAFRSPPKAPWAPWDGGSSQVLLSQTKEQKLGPVAQSELWDLYQRGVGVEGKKPNPPFPCFLQMVWALLEFLSRKGPPRGKLRPEPHIPPLLKPCHARALDANLTNTFGIPKLLRDTLYFLNMSGCWKAKLSCPARLHFFLHTLNPPAHAKRHRCWKDKLSWKHPPSKSFISKKPTLQLQM